jgi:simple sugar transport system ATP-binding protein
VLRNGALVGEYPIAELGHNALIAAMVGHELAADQSQSKGTKESKGAAQTALLQAKGLARAGSVKALDLSLHKGEVVGLGGLLGSGRTELARVLFGLDPKDAGELRVNGEPVTLDSPVHAIRLGLGLCPEDRKAEGIIGELSVRENIALALQARQGLWPCISRAKQTEMAEHYVNSLGIKTSHVDSPIGQLSGGNQQKAMLARWMATQPSLLILDEPTRGIDIAAKQEIMNEILAMAKKGMAVLFISSEMEEVVRVSDRIVVMRDRSKVGELPGGTSSQAVYAMIAGQA